MNIKFLVPFLLVGLTVDVNSKTFPIQNEDTCMEKCNFYKCFEDKMHCGPTAGYFLAYAYPMCTRYYEFYDLFNAAGKNFIDCTRQKLIDVLLPYYNSYPNGVSCGCIKEKAFDSHYPVYKACGFCSAVYGNIKAFCTVFKTLGFWEKFGYFVKMMKECLIGDSYDVKTQQSSMYSGLFCDICQDVVNGIKSLTPAAQSNTTLVQNIVIESCDSACTFFPDCLEAIKNSIVNIFRSIENNDAKSTCQIVNFCD